MSSLDAKLERAKENMDAIVKIEDNKKLLETIIDRKNEQRERKILYTKKLFEKEINTIALPLNISEEPFLIVAEDIAGLCEVNFDRKYEHYHEVEKVYCDGKSTFASYCTAFYLNNIDFTKDEAYFNGLVDKLTNAEETLYNVLLTPYKDAIARAAFEHKAPELIGVWCNGKKIR